MLDLLSFAVLGFWLGLVVRLKLKHQVMHSQRFGIAGAILVALLILILALGSSPETAGRWSAITGLSAFWALGLIDETAEKLSKIWAGFWLPAVFVALEIARAIAVAAYCERFQWAC